MSDSAASDERVFEPRRAANITFLVAFLLVAITASAFYTGNPGRVGYGWMTLAGGVALALFALGVRLGWGWLAYPACAVLGAFDLWWMIRLLDGFDVGLAIWMAICFFAIRDMWPGLDEKFPWLKKNP